MTPTPFDATLDVSPSRIAGAGLTGREDEVREAVRATVEAMPGAFWISVEAGATIPSRIPWRTLYRRGRGGAQTGPEGAPARGRLAAPN